jgi:hypothetical protein
VNRSDRICTFLRLHRDALAPLGILSKFWCLLVLASIVAGGAPRADAQSTPAISAGPALPFAFSDFDRDLHPDLAVVQVGRSDHSSTDYWVQFQLTAAAPQAILVVAPTGGLQIAARDVNGDQFPDLVLTTAWLERPVAILLNDGHGRFSRVDPAAFPKAFSSSKTNWRCSASPEQELLGVPSQSRSGACSEAARLPHLVSSIRATRSTDCGFLLCPDLVSHQGRAPPSELPHF